MSEQKYSTSAIINLILQLTLLAFLLTWCFLILQSFISPIIWATVMAITLFPLHKRLTKYLRGRSAWSAMLITLFVLILFIVPAGLFFKVSIDEFQEIKAGYAGESFHLAAPSESVKDWPLIGGKVYSLWLEAATDLPAFMQSHGDQFKELAVGALKLLGSTGKGLLLLTLSIIISGVFLAYSERSGETAKKILVRLAGKSGEEMVSLAIVTIRNVAKGILGVAAIQSFLAGLGFVIAGVPAAGLLVLICFILALVQLGLFPVVIGVIIYIWNTADPLTASLLTIWMLFIGTVDNVLKPILLGKGAPVPMIVVFLGAIGGFILSGFIGLFTGAIVLSLGYKLFELWSKQDETIIEIKKEVE